MFNFIETSFYILFVRVLCSIHTSPVVRFLFLSPSYPPYVRSNNVRLRRVFVLFVSYVSPLSLNEMYIERSRWKMIGGDTNKIITYMDVERDVVGEKKRKRNIANAENIIQVSCSYHFFYFVFEQIYI